MGDLFTYKTALSNYCNVDVHFCKFLYTFWTMTFSDDDMLNDLADEMLHEIKHNTGGKSSRGDTTTIPLRAETTQQAMIGNSTSSGPYDLNRMMSQMMPMMSQLMGNIDCKQPARITNNQPKLEEILPKYLSANEAQKWSETIHSDQVIMESAYSRNGVLGKAHSYSYGHGRSSLSSSGVKIERLMRTFLKEGITSSKLTERYNSKTGHLKSMDQVLDTKLVALFKVYLQDVSMQKLASDTDVDILRDRKSDKVEHIVAAGSNRTRTI